MLSESQPATPEKPDPSSVPWYHTIELPSGPTPGEYDHRPTLRRVPLPDLRGLRCLDIGTHDGFWAFEMEKRGAASVLAIDIENPADIDWPEPRPAMTEELRDMVAERKKAFEIARVALDSKVEHRYLSAYQLSAELVGTFDFVYIGTLLHHLRDPIGALMAIRSVTTGTLCISAAISLSKTVFYPTASVTEIINEPGAPFWELPNISALRRQVEAAGFHVQFVGRPYLQRFGAGKKLETGRTFGRGRIRQLPVLLVRTFGIPHVSLTAVPRPSLEP